MPLIGIFQWFESSSLGVAIRASTYAFAVLECLHLMGMVCLLGSLVAIDLRLLGFGMKRLPVAKVASALAPITWVGLATMIVTGLMLFSSEAMKCYDNAAFPWKMAFLLLALILYFSFHRRVSRLDDARIGPVFGKVVGALSLVFWFGVALAGRAIAFV
jgi:hypothetical protein